MGDKGVSSCSYIGVGEVEESVLCQVTKNTSEGNQPSLTKKRVQKWKKLAREKCYNNSLIPLVLNVGEKRSKTTVEYDAHMEDMDERGNNKKRIIPMEVDNVYGQDSENVGSLTSWALGFQ